MTAYMHQPAWPSERRRCYLCHRQRECTWIGDRWICVACANVERKYGTLLYAVVVGACAIGAPLIAWIARTR